MKSLSSFVSALAVGLLVLAVTAPAIAALANSLLPLIIVGTVAAVVLRLVFVHTRRF